MELRTWTPLLDLEREMRTMLDRYWPPEGTERALRLTTDMHRDENGLVVTVEVPGIDAEKVDVSVEGDTLMIAGEKSDEHEVKEEDRFLRERRYGRFERRITLPDGVDPDSVTASYDKGVLTVRVPLPTPEETQPRKVPVRLPG